METRDEVLRASAVPALIKYTDCLLAKTAADETKLNNLSKLLPKLCQGRPAPLFDQASFPLSSQN